METVSLQPRLANLPGKRNELCNLRLAQVKACVEAGDLRHAGQPLRDCLNGCEVVRLVQWGKRYKFVELFQDLARHHYRPPKARAAMNNAVAHTEYSRSAPFGLEQVDQRANGGLSIPDRVLQIAVGQHFAVTILRGEPW